MTADELAKLPDDALVERVGTLLDILWRQQWIATNNGGESGCAWAPSEEWAFARDLREWVSEAQARGSLVGYEVMEKRRWAPLDWTAAGAILDRMSELGWWARVKSPFADGMSWWAGFTPHGVTGFNGVPDHEANADSAPRAIAIAAILAVGRCADDL